jgi:hypothetical protein
MEQRIWRSVSSVFSVCFIATLVLDVRLPTVRNIKYEYFNVEYGVGCLMYSTSVL